MSHQEQKLRVPEQQLSTSRQQFIQTLENKKQFEADCAVIIPELDRLWETKILNPLGMCGKDEHKCANGCGDGGCEPAPGEKKFVMHTANPDNWVINWRHYLYNYTPQLLAKSITRLASRLKLEGNSVQRYDGMEVKNVAAYFKSLVRDARIKELKREHYGEKMRGMVAAKEAGYVVGQLTPYGMVTMVGRVTVFGSRDNAAIPAYVLDNGVIHHVECPKCFDEEGSYACIRPAHKGRQAEVSMETVAFDMMEDSKQ